MGMGLGNNSPPVAGSSRQDYGGVKEYQQFRKSQQTHPSRMSLDHSSRPYLNTLSSERRTVAKFQSMSTLHQIDQLGENIEQLCENMNLLSIAVEKLISLYKSEHVVDQEEYADLSKTVIDTRYSPYI